MFGSQTKHTVVIDGKDKTSRAFDSVKQNIGGLTGALGGLKGVVAGVLGFAGMGALIKSSMDFGDRLHKLNLRLGTSVEALSELRHAAQLSGLEFNAVAIGMQRMTRRVAEAASAGSGPAVKTLQQLGLSAKALAALKPEQQLEVLADALHGVESESERVRLAFSLFDSEGVGILQMGNADAIRAMREEAADLGLTLDKVSAQAIADANDAMTRMGSATVSLGNALAVGLAPTLEATANFIQDNIPSAVNVAKGAFNFLSEYLVKMSAGVTRWLGGLSYRLGSLAEFVGADEIGRSLKNTGNDYAATAALLKDMGKDYEANGAMVHKFTVEVDRAKMNLKDFEGATYSLAEKNKAAAKAQAEYNKQVAAGKAVFDKTRTPVEKMKIEVERLNELWKAGAIDVDTYNRAVTMAGDDYNAAMDKMKDKGKDTFDDLKNAVEGWGNAFTDTLADAVMTGKASFKDLANSIIRDILRIQIKERITKPLVTMGTKFLDGLFGRAIGGPVLAGTPYIVGEQGPELFVPSSSGSVMTNDRLINSGGGDSIVFEQSVSIDARGATPDVEPRIRQAMAETKADTIATIQRSIKRGGTGWRGR